MSNTAIGVLNLITLLASVPIIGAGLWMARSNSTCESTLQTPLLVIGFVVLVVSLAGFVGSCFNVTWALWLYLVVMLLLMVALVGLTVFGFIVTGRGGGVEVPGKKYKEYHLEEYASWLRNRFSNDNYWSKIRSCLMSSKVCSKIVSWTPVDYITRDLSPVQSGCCKPPTSCNYDPSVSFAQQADCYKWNNDPSALCYACDSCKAGVLETARMKWHRISLMNVFVLMFLIAVYSVGCCAFRNARRDEYHYHYSQYGRTPVNKAHPGRDHINKDNNYWW